MKQTRVLMDMPITVEIVDATRVVGSSSSKASEAAMDAVFSYFNYVDAKFSTFKATSEISRINRGETRQEEYSGDMKTVLALCRDTKSKTDGYFDIVTADGKLDPSGLVKGWAVRNAADILEKRGFRDFYVDAGGDMEVRGKNSDGGLWKIGIRNPFNLRQNVKVLHVSDRGVATSGSYIRGHHVYNPFERNKPLADVVSLTVVGPDVLEADRFATAAFAMGANGIRFIEKTDGLEGYSIAGNGIATWTSGLGEYLEEEKQERAEND